MPSARLWLGNISNQVTAPMVRAAFEGFGVVVDAAAFPARIGPLGYAIVVFDRVRHEQLVCFARLPAISLFVRSFAGLQAVRWLRASSFCTFGSSVHALTQRLVSPMLCFDDSAVCARVK